MHKVGIRQEIIDRVLARRGRLYLFDRFAPAETALVVIDMQPTFVAPGAPAEVPASLLGHARECAVGGRQRLGRVFRLFRCRRGARRDETGADHAIGGACEPVGPHDRSAAILRRSSLVQNLPQSDRDGGGFAAERRFLCVGMRRQSRRSS